MACPLVTPADSHRILKNFTRWERVDKIDILDRDGWKCAYCHTPVDIIGSTPTSNDFTRATLDHIIPISLGGDHTYTNIVTACLDCNGIKGNDPRYTDIALLLTNLRNETP